jgi:hypothetical protein
MSPSSPASSALSCYQPHQRNLHRSPLPIGHDGSRSDIPLPRLRRIADRRSPAPPTVEDPSGAFHSDDPHNDCRGPKSAHRARGNRDGRRRRLICANFDRDPASELIVDQGRWSWGQRHGRLGSGRSGADPPQLKSLLAPQPSEGMICWPVGPGVGNVKNDDPGLISAMSRHYSLAAVFGLGLVALTSCDQGTAGQGSASDDSGAYIRTSGGTTPPSVS